MELSVQKANFTVGEAAHASGMSAKMIRHYEQIGLLKQATRTDAGYRLYNKNDVHVLKFIRHSRDLGFSLKQIQDLLSLWQDKQRNSKEVKALANTHLDALNAKIQELQTMKLELEKLVKCCKGDNRPECPILEGLQGDGL
ncbi:MAG: Cu(I)-responsive transcriptional regulator [Limnobacter sp.]|nr:Cu(I)-responsive transcriptional regulator [Limnobacter sp.]